MSNRSPEFLDEKARWVRRTVLEMAVRAKSGHVTSAFSQTELLVALYYGGILRVRPDQPEWPGRDRFILSKGQGGIGLYPILADLGFFPREELDRFTQRGSKLGVHCEWHVPGIETVSGSLGHGLPVATGMAEAARRDGKDHLVVLVTGDAELYEGSNWEAAIVASARRYDNLVVIVDRNGQGVLGHTDPRDDAYLDWSSDGPALEPLAAKFAAFGWETKEIDGHDWNQIFTALDGVRERQGRGPLAVVARTVKGKGVPLLENQRRWHYRVPEGEELEQARQALA